MINPKLITIFILVQKSINFFFVSEFQRWKRDSLDIDEKERNSSFCHLWATKETDIGVNGFHSTREVFLRCFKNLNLLEKVDCSREKKKWFDFMFFDQFRYMFVEILVYFLFLWCFLGVLCQNRLKIEFWIKKHPSLIFQPSQVVEIWINRQYFICIVFK